MAFLTSWRTSRFLLSPQHSIITNKSSINVRSLVSLAMNGKKEVDFNERSFVSSSFSSFSSSSFSSSSSSSSFVGLKRPVHLSSCPSKIQHSNLWPACLEKRKGSFLFREREEVQQKRFLSRSCLVLSKENDESKETNKPTTTTTTNSPRKKRGWIVWVGSMLFLAMGKTKYVVVALKLAKFPTLFSMFASSLLYSFVFGPAFGVGLVGMILVHEAGHALAMKYYKIPFSPMVFIPFLGGAVGAKTEIKDPVQAANISLAGPFLGGAVAVLAAGGGFLLDSQFLLAMGDFGLMMNLLQLLPIQPLDGGRVASALSKWLLVGGLAMGTLGITSGILSNPLMYLIMLSGLYTTVGCFRGWIPMKEVPTKAKFHISLMYLGLVSGFVLCMSFTHKFLLSPQKLKKERIQRGEESDSISSNFEKTLLSYSEMEEDQDDEIIWNRKGEEENNKKWN